VLTYLVEALCYSWKVTGSKPDEVNEFSSMYPNLTATLDAEVYSVSNRTEYQRQK
jgi:hypothetical protein